MASEDLPANGHGGPADPAKLALRRAHRAARAAYVAGLATGRRDRLERDLADRLADMLPPGIVAGYAAAGSEIGLAGLGRAALLPHVAAGGPLLFRPAAGGPAAVPDVVVVPLIAVDHAGHRLGQGGGHYDRTLAALRAAGRVFAVGAAWDMQLVETLAADPWDQPLDALATPTRWLTFAAVPPKPAR